MVPNTYTDLSSAGVSQALDEYALHTQPVNAASAKAELPPVPHGQSIALPPHSPALTDAGPVTGTTAVPGVGEVDFYTVAVPNSRHTKAIGGHVAVKNPNAAD